MRTATSCSRHARRPVPRLLCASLAIAVASAASATPQKDKSWDALIAQARKYGGEETKLDRAASYVFQRPEGDFITITRMLDGSRRAVCAIDKQQHVTVCLDWDSGATRWSEREDAASPWIQHDKLPEEPSPLKPLASLLSRFLSVVGTTRFTPSGGFYLPRN